MKALLVFFVLVLFYLSAANNSIPTAVSSAAQPIGDGRISHVIVIVLENEPYNQVIGNSQAPYENMLAGQYALAANYFSPEHPSLPNYIDLTAGSDMGITSDCSPSSTCQVTGSNVADLLSSNGLSWKEYAESMPAPCYQSDSGYYAVRHNPFVYYVDVTSNAAYCDSHVVAFEDPSVGFYADLNNSRLPNYSFITPNLCDDGHDTCQGSTSNLAQADTWLSNILPKIISSNEFASTAVFVVYDEGNFSTTTSQVYSILVSPFSSRSASTTYYTHFSLLATVEGIFNLGTLGRNDSTSSPMFDLFSLPSLPSPSIDNGNVTIYTPIAANAKFMSATISINSKPFSSVFNEEAFPQFGYRLNGTWGYMGYYQSNFGAISGCQPGSLITLTVMYNGNTESATNQCPARSSSASINITIFSSS
ncbi:MAG: alkaline phosphatase family protein [Nitrososphaerales archaeon]